MLLLVSAACVYTATSGVGDAATQHVQMESKNSGDSSRLMAGLQSSSKSGAPAIVTAILLGRANGDGKSQLKFLTYRNAAVARTPNAMAGDTRNPEVRLVKALVPKGHDKSGKAVKLDQSEKTSLDDSEKSAASFMEQMQEMHTMHLGQYTAVLTGMGVPQTEINKLTRGKNAEKRCHRKIEELSRSIRDSCPEKVNEDVAIVLVQGTGPVNPAKSSIAYSCKKNEALHIITTFDN